jgi:plastocyanin
MCSRGPRLFLLAAFTLSVTSGCEPDPPSPTDPELALELGLAPETPIHSVLLSGRGDQTRVLPGHTTVRAGELVQFRVMDGRVHLVRFDADGLDVDAARFLEESGQSGFPPLTERDARLVVSFIDAPAGRYPFVVEGHGAPVSGSIVVETH